MTKKDRQDRVQDHIQFVAETLIRQIEAGAAPWQRPWKPGERPLAHNLLTRNDYQGCNQMWLMMVSAADGFTDTRWGTYRQIKEAGGQVRRGEKGYHIMAVFEVGREAREKAEQEARDRGEDPPRFSRRMMPKVYTVFNAVQADGLPPLEVETPSWEPCERAEEILQKSGVPIKHGGECAYYNLTQDTIHLPHKSRFATPEAYYAAALHELAHTTGHSDRMNRELLTYGENTDAYAHEELRAEINALMVCTQLGLGYDSQNGSAYVKNWVSIFKDTPEEIRVATTDAHKMSSYLLRGMGKELKAPDLSWTESSSLDIPKHKAEDRSGKDISSSPDMIDPHTEKLEKDQMSLNGQASTVYISQPEWVCVIKRSQRSTIPCIDFATNNLVGSIGRLFGQTPEEVASTFLQDVRSRNPKADLSGYIIEMKLASQERNRAPYEFIVGGLHSLQRRSRTDQAHQRVEMEL